LHAATVTLQEEFSLIRAVLEERTQQQRAQARAHSRTVKELRDQHAQFKAQYDALKAGSLSVTPRQRAYWLSALPDQLRTLKRLVQFLRGRSALYASLYEGGCLRKIR
jgi:hypothetical protein